MFAEMAITNFKEIRENVIGQKHVRQDWIVQTRIQVNAHSNNDSPPALVKTSSDDAGSLRLSVRRIKAKDSNRTKSVTTPFSRVSFDRTECRLNQHRVKNQLLEPLWRCTAILPIIPLLSGSENRCTNAIPTAGLETPLRSLQRRSENDFVFIELWVALKSTLFQLNSALF